MKKILCLLLSVLFFLGCSGSQLVQPELKEQIIPVYPYEARINGIEGVVDLLLELNESGDVINTKVIKTSRQVILDDASIEYSKRLKFKPESLIGLSRPIYIKWELNYKLDGIDVENSKLNLLVFSKTNGYRHESIESGKIILKEIADENNFLIDFSEDSKIFTSDLSKYNVIVFLNTYGNIFNPKEEESFKNYIQHKGGFVGIHSASATEPDWEWYVEMLGAKSESSETISQGNISIVEKNHPSTKYLPYNWVVTDEWNNLSTELPDDIKVLAYVKKIDPVNQQNVSYPFCWYHEFDGGRCWYTTAGHNPKTFTEPLFKEHILGGIKYAAGIE